MSHVFEGEPDARQSDQVDLKPSRFRPTYRALTDDEKNLHDHLKTSASHIEGLIAAMPDGPGGASRYKALAMTALEESIMWAVKALTS